MYLIPSKVERDGRTGGRYERQFFSLLILCRAHLYACKTSTTGYGNKKHTHAHTTHPSYTQHIQMHCCRHTHTYSHTHTQGRVYMSEVFGHDMEHVMSFKTDKWMWIWTKMRKGTQLKSMVMVIRATNSAFTSLPPTPPLPFQRQCIKKANPTLSPIHAQMQSDILS